MYNLNASAARKWISRIGLQFPDVAQERFFVKSRSARLRRHASWVSIVLALLHTLSALSTGPTFNGAEFVNDAGAEMVRIIFYIKIISAVVLMAVALALRCTAFTNRAGPMGVELFVCFCS
jgi:hypothetical protein